MRRLLSLAAGIAMLAAAGFAQTDTTVSYSDNFQSYGTQANPPGWLDTSVGDPHPVAPGLYKTWSDPLDPSNIVFGTKQSSGKPDGNNPRIGTFSTLGTYSFAGKGRFEYRGRLLRTDAEGRIGLTFFSEYPEVDQYYLIGLWSQPSGQLTMQLFGFGGGTPAGTVDSNVTIPANVWYRFLIQVDDVDQTTKIRARFWKDGTTEPDTFSIEAADASSSRLTTGRIGIWAAVKGDAYFDDLSAKSPVDHTPPTIAFFESGNPLADGAKFNRDATPEIRVADDLSTFTFNATLDGQPYTSLTPVTVEGWHTLDVHAVDAPGNASEASVKFLVDKTPPVIALLESGKPFPSGFYFNRDIVATASVTDISQTTATATVDGQPYTLGSPISAEGKHSISVTAVDEVGWTSTAGPIPFVIDKTPPALAFSSQHDGDVVTTPTVTVAGTSDDSVTVLIGTNPATVDPNAKTFTAGSISLVEGTNTIVATGTDRAGNIGTATLHLVLDTRPPQLTIATPAAGACVDATALTVTGTATDPHLGIVNVVVGNATPVAATVAPDGTWTAAVPVADEGTKLITVQASDTAGHTVSVSRSVSIDRTAPAVDVLESGAPFTAAIVNHPVSLFVRATDADPAMTVTATLDGAAYASGTSIAAEGKHALAVTAKDCANHETDKSVNFTIDLTPPAIRNLTPANGGTVGTLPTAIGGSTDPDTATVAVAGTQLSGTPAADGTFTIAAVPFTEGSNHFALIATDQAGNRTTVNYNVTVRTAGAAVTIRESGLPIANGTIYNRTVAPVIASNDPQATIAATLNGTSYTSGTAITNDGDYTLNATATDTLGHTTTAQATFTIDKTPPVVKITAPAAGTIQADHVSVSGTTTDAVSATINGQPVALASDGTFAIASLPLEIGANSIVAIARDRAGNTARDEVVVTRDDTGTGLLVTYPTDHSLTNRPTTDVVGRLLTPGRVTSVTIGTTGVPVDPTGAFRLSGYTLTEGDNAITASAVAANGVQTSATVHVTADFTAPALSVLESGQPLTDGARFATQAVISLQASDAASGPPATTLTVDGTAVTTIPLTITAAGGHSLVATATDLAGNESRVERTLFIGATTGTSGCNLDPTSFDPADGSVILSHTTALVGRSGGAVGVKVNGVAAVVVDGSFSATVELPNEGPNSVAITCTDANGNPTGTPATLTLQRVTGDPSITIDTPSESFVSAQDTIAVSGTVGAGVVSADVNGVAATITGSDSTVPRPYTVAAVRLTGGLNMLIAHGRNAAGRVATASRRGVYIKDAPAITISAPPSSTTTGDSKITISGTYTNIDPTTLAVTNLGAAGQTPQSAQFVKFGDTTGSFTAANVPLVNGTQTLQVSGVDRLNRQATATVAVTSTPGTPSIAISSPADHAYFPGGNSTVTVTGTFQAAAGSTVDVNGVTATVTGNTYSAAATFSTLAGGITPIVAHVTEPAGANAFATIVVTQVADAPKVLQSFPAPGAAEIDSGALLLVLFSQPMDGTTTASSFSVVDASGAPVSGALFLDKDVLTFAPATLLASGGQYTMKVAAAAKNLAGTPMAADYTATFTVATSAPASAPAVDPIASAICGSTLTVTGTASPAARMRLDIGPLTLDGAADTTGKFSFTVPLSGQSGFALVRVRVVGSDGSLSPSADLNVRVDCTGPQVVGASFDRSANKLTVQFSEAVAPASVTMGSGGVVLTRDDGTNVSGTVAVAQNLATITPAADLTAATFSLTVGTAVTDVIGNHLASAYSQNFATAGTQPVAGDGSGFISGEVFDATTGRPLAGASVNIDVASSAPVATSTDARGRYLARVPEGAHTIKAALTGYTSVWRQIVVPAGTGVIPIDIRLTARGAAKTSDGSAIALTHGGDTTVTKKIDLSVPAGVVATGHNVALTAIGAQALTGLLPLGWSPIAAAEIVVDGSDAASPVAGAQLTFHVPAADVTSAAQNLTAAQYDSTRDEWRVLTSAVNVASDGTAVVPVATSGAFVLAYPDKAAGLTVPPLPVSGDVLRGVPPAAADAPALVEHDFVLNPALVLPNGRTVATLRIEGSGAATFPSGTAVQAYIDEELRLADGSTLLDPPFATDLLLYRSLAGDLGVADFHLAPSPRAAQVILDVGFDHIRIQPYPGRLDRGTLIGSEGGHVPADDKVAVDIPTGAVPEPVRAAASSMSASDLAAIGSIAGFRLVGGFALTLQRATQPPPQDLDGDGQPDPIPPVELFIPARATFTVDSTQLPSPAAQVILGELLDDTPFGKMIRLADPMMPVDAAQTSTPAVRFTTRAIDRSSLPVDGVAHEGRYVVLAAEAPIAYATGTVHLLSTATGRLLADARVLTPSLGVPDVSRTTGIYNVPVPATPAAPFTLVPRHATTGDGAAYTNAASPAADSVVHVDLAVVPQPPALSSVVVLQGDPPAQATVTAGAVTTNVALTTNVRASFTPAIDPSSITDSSITVLDALTGATVSGKAAADGTVAVVWTLTPGTQLKSNGRYNIVIASTIRGANGAAYNGGGTYSFATVTQLANADVHPERIRITIPDANGISKIIGDPGALPAGWQAVPVRRNVDFVVRYQGTAATDGSFSFTIGNGDPSDRIGLGDLIDLQAVNTAGNVAAILPLTPFVTEDGHGFVAPVGTDVTFTTPEGIALTVPAGAFDTPTVVTVTTLTKNDFEDIPKLDSENEFGASVRVDFAGTANKPLTLSAPVPAGYDTTGKQFILAQKMMSMQGPRLALIDLATVVNGKFINGHDDATSSSIRAVKLGLTPGTNQTLTGSKFTKYLLMLMQGGMFMYLSIIPPVPGPVGFAVMEGFQAGYDLTWSIFWSYFVPHIAIVERGGAVIPVLSNTQFTVTGTDPSTGLQSFTRAYDPIPFGSPGTVVPIDSPQQNDGGPYPVFGSPFRVEMIDLDAEKVDINSVRNFTARLDGGSVTVTPSGLTLDDGNIEMMNISNGAFTSGSAIAPLSLNAKVGDRIVLLVEQREVDPTVPVSVVFSEPIFVSGTTDDTIDAFLRKQIKVEQAPEPPAGGTPAYVDVTPQVHFTTDSGNRRVNVAFSSALQREAVYRLTLSPDIADVVNDAAGMKLGQGTVADASGNLSPAGGGNPVHLVFHVRKPAGPLGAFTASPGGIITGMDLAGNVLFVAATQGSGGLYAYDMSNPAAVASGAPPLLGSIPGIPTTAVNHRAVTIDRHNRVYTTAELASAGMFRSYRVEDFTGGTTTPRIMGSTLINWRLGYSSGLGLPSNTMLSDRPESIPFRIKLMEQDDERPYANRQAFAAVPGVQMVQQYPDDLQQFTASLAMVGGDYHIQRITVENQTLDMRWSADAINGSPAVINNIIARSTDKLRIIYNFRTYAIVAHLGYGVGIYDANAIESNRAANLPPTDPNHLREQVILTAGKIDPTCPNTTPDYGIVEGYLPTDAELRAGPGPGELYSYSIDPYRGVLDLRLTSNKPPTMDNACNQRPDQNTGGLLFHSAPAGHEISVMTSFHDAFVGAAGREPFNHFTQLDRFHWSVTATENAKGLRGTKAGAPAQRDYLLVSGFDYGLIVVEIDGKNTNTIPWPLLNDNVADIIWIPGGAAGVRVYQDANTAVVTDRYGRVVLVDLSRIDERWDAQGNRISGLFPTVTKALAGQSADGLGVGADDPRIIWKSDPGVVSGTLAPVFDPNTGMVFAGDMTGRQMKVVSAVDPRVSMKVLLDGDGLSDVGGIVPLGVAPPADIQSRITALPACDGTTIRCKENASLGAFRLEVALPGNMADSLTQSNNQLQLAVESERIEGAITEQTPDGFPRAHLRRTRRDGSPESSSRAATNFWLKRLVPDALAPALKNQRGYNRFVSPWIIAIADPRASSQYNWNGATPQQKKDAGCESCDRPKFLQSLGESDGVYELWTNGRFIAVRPELFNGTTTIFNGTNYGYLGTDKRLMGRFSTIMADTVRPPETLVAAQNPPLANGILQETVFLHSGELQSHSLDLDAGGRANFGVLFDRIYRSRTLGGSVLGQGWDAPWLRRLRALPNGDVEYRDGAEVWRFTASSSGYDSPKGLFLRLSRTERGWKLVDQKWRVTEFDDLGRIVATSDEFFDPQVAGSGNTIRYLYDQDGRLSAMIDPVHRISTLSYWSESEAGVAGAYPGLLKEALDWRNRAIDYNYDAAAGTLTKVKLTDVPNTSGGRPEVHYTYGPSGGNFNDNLELRSNLLTITDPHEALTGGSPRVTFQYGDTGGNRDHLLLQTWGTGETASFTYSGATNVTTKDVLGQSRQYTLSPQPKDYVSDRAHVLSLVEQNVTTSTTPFGELPQSITADVPATGAKDRTFTFTYNSEGLVQSASLNGVRSATFAYHDASPAAPGMIDDGSTTTSQGGTSDSVTRSIDHQTGANSSTLPESYTAGGQTVNAADPSRSATTITEVNNAVQLVAQCRSDALLRFIKRSGGTKGQSKRQIASATGDASDVEASYAPEDDAAQYRRSMPVQIDRGGLTTTIEYPSEDQERVTDERGTIRTTDYDALRHELHTTISGGEGTSDERYDYDASGRIRKMTTKLNGKDVTTTYDYDVVGRQTSETMDNVTSAGGTITTTTKYDLGSGTVTTTHPGGAVTTTKIDSLGRITSEETTTGSSPVDDYFAYDLDSNLVFHTDLLNASASAYDGQQRLVATLSLDGTKTAYTNDAWGRPTGVTETDGSGNVVAQSTYAYTDAGRLKSIDKRIDDAQVLQTRYSWDGAERTSGVSESGRATVDEYDSAGRLVSSQSGAGDEQSVTTAFEETDVSGHDGLLPQKAQKKEKNGNAYDVTVQYNTFSQQVTHTLGGLDWERHFDEDGNLVSEKAPNRSASGYSYDSRGSLLQQSLPAGTTITHTYDPTGAPTSFIDASNEETTTTTDLIGRPLTRTYKDGTTEQIQWEGRRVKSFTDRQGRTQVFGYNAKGQIATISDAGGNPLDSLEYDSAGRLVKWTNRDSVVEMSNFNLDGKPQHTVQTRLRDGNVVDSYAQDHGYNVHGERSHWTMPAYAGLAPAAGWTQSLDQDFDAKGNIVQIRRSLFGAGPAVLLDADYRNLGRPDRRTTTTAGGIAVDREYSYDGSNGLLTQVQVTSNGQLIAGSKITYDGLQRTIEQILGVSAGARSNQWGYDQRSRLRSSTLARDDDSTPATSDLTAGDFRSSLLRPATTPGDPPSVTFTENASGGHKIAQVQRGSDVESFVFSGGQRVEDGRFQYSYDEKSRLKSVTEKTYGTATSLRRVLYSYDGHDRLIGRRAEYAVLATQGAAPQATDWKLEDRPQVIAADGLPPETTFVWDPISDRLVSIFKAGASQNPQIDANGGLLRQTIHGGLGLDDPIEVTATDPISLSAPVHLYPIYDEGGAGFLQAVVNDQGRLVSRSTAGGPYGEDEAVLAGPAVDKVSVAFQKDSSGNITAVQVTLRSTEAIDATTLATGLRLSVVTSAGDVVRSTSKTPVLQDAATALWTFTQSEWSDFVASTGTQTATALSIAATNTLRASAWSPSQGVTPAPAWAVASKPVYTSSSTPMEVRESLSTLTDTMTTTPSGATKTDVVYSVPALVALGTPRRGTTTAADPERMLVASAFHAHPFQEPVTGENYVRSRWFDQQTGVWLTPDPSGYADSSNLYAYAGQDPVNHRDPTGMYEADVHYGLTMYLALQAGFTSGQAIAIAEMAEMPDQRDESNPIRVTVRALKVKLAMQRYPEGKVPQSEIDEYNLLTGCINALHFPRGDHDPSRVEPLSTAAQAITKAGIDSGNIMMFGLGLHPLEDSYSHAGVPGLFGISGHPNDQGGSFEHIADQPQIRPLYALEMAKTVYEQMIDYRNANPGQHYAGEPAAWTAIEDSVLEFARLDNKIAKRRWLLSHNVWMPPWYWDDVTAGPADTAGLSRLQKTGNWISDKYGLAKDLGAGLMK